MNAAVSFKDIEFSYKEDKVLRHINFEVPEGSLSCLIGPNGAGKSTLFKLALGLERLQQGEILFFGENFERVKKSIAYMPQKEKVDLMFPATVFDFVLTGRLLFRPFYLPYSKEDKKEAEKAIGRVGLIEHQNKGIAELSGGQFKRMLFARALAQQPTLFLLDEPFAGVDLPSEKIIISILKDLVKAGKTVLIVHHDLATLEDYFDYGFLLNTTLIAEGTPATLLEPQNLELGYGKVFITPSV